jgi:hypothetical protein
MEYIFHIIILFEDINVDIPSVPVIRKINGHSKTFKGNTSTCQKKGNTSTKNQ